AGRIFGAFVSIDGDRRNGCEYVASRGLLNLDRQGLSTTGIQPYSYSKRVTMADGRQQQRQRRRPCFRSVPAHRIIGGGLGRRYDHAALLGDHRFDDGVFDDDLDRLPSDDHQRQQQQQRQQQEPLRRLIGEARLVSPPLEAGMPPPPPSPPPLRSQPGQREVQEVAGGLEARRGERPRHRQPHEEEKEERGAALALLPPPLAGEVSVPGAEDTAPQPPGGIRVEDSMNNVNNSHNGRIRPQPASLPPPPPAGRGGGDPALGFRARRRGGQAAAAAAAAAAAGEWGGALEACPPWGRSGGSSAEGQQQQQGMPPLTGDGSGRVASLTSMCLE
ncbi:unnamed protein product, partial [Ectocarpus sp. 12 AP-2014]